jgi:plasmid stabilization system protein ParE
MRLVYLDSAAADLRWFKQYYSEVFTEGRVKADQQFLATQKLLKANAFIGQVSEYSKEVREHQIPRTPFTVIYRVVEDRIEVLRVVDGRSDWRGR